MDSFLKWKNPKSLLGFEPTDRGVWKWYKLREDILDINWFILCFTHSVIRTVIKQSFHIIVLWILRLIFCYLCFFSVKFYTFILIDYNNFFYNTCVKCSFTWHFCIYTLNFTNNHNLITQIHKCWVRKVFQCMWQSTIIVWSQ
jgi:hypothetical protein